MSNQLRWTEPFSDGEIYGMSGKTPFFTIQKRENDYLLTSQLLESPIGENESLKALKELAESRFKAILKDSGLAPVKSLMKANIAELARTFMWDAFPKYIGSDEGLKSFKEDFNEIVRKYELEGESLKYFKLRLKGILDFISRDCDKFNHERDYRRLLSRHMKNHFDHCEQEWLK